MMKVFGLTCLAISIASTPLSAQSTETRSKPASVNWQSIGRGMMMGPGMMDRTEFSRMCKSGSAGFSEWRFERLDEILQPTDAQRVKFEDYKSASKKARETMRAACPTEVPNSMVTHMQAMEKLTDAKASAIKSVLPSLQEFYSTLNADQKLKLDSNAGRSRFWHGA